MPTNDAHLYGAKKVPKLSGKEFVSTSSLTFASHLSGLIASNKTADPKAAGRNSSAGRQRHKKEDIFTVHNKNVKKRALKDLDEADFSQKHSATSEQVDDAQWHRAKRRMEEKARLYAALKRGDVEDQDERYAVDFDKKWAEAREKGEGYDTSSGESDNDASAGEEELIDYIDEFGRNVKGTRAQVAREERRKNKPVDDTDRFTARPAMPSNVIYGDTVQTAAFNPDESIAKQMEELAQKRDKELTPPPDEHFDGKKEIRTKGVGFFHFSADSEERRRQMAALEKERLETEARREETQKRKNDRKKEIEDRRRAIQQKRSRVQADKFLDGLSGEMEAQSSQTPDDGDGG